jgi:Fe-S-cluster containining protein
MPAAPVAANPAGNIPVEDSTCLRPLEHSFSISMAIDLVQIRTLAQEKEVENWRFRHFLKVHCALPLQKIDQEVFQTTRRVWAGIDCTTCANCCRQLQPTFSEQELDRLARRLGLERGQAIEKYLERTEAGSPKPWRTRTTPCPFLKANLCSIYDDRPADCSGYPYLYEQDFVFRTVGMIARTSTCPIVYEVMESLKESLGFFRRRARRRRY